MLAIDSGRCTKLGFNASPRSFLQVPTARPANIMLMVRAAGAVASGVLFVVCWLGWNGAQQVAASEWIDVRVGQRVVPVRGNVPVRYEEHTVATLTPTSVLEVLAMRGGWAQVRAGRSTGWVRRDDLIPEADVERICTSVIASYPTDPHAYNLRGVHAYRRGRDHEALADFERVLQLAPHDTTALSNRGAVRDRLGRHVEAIEDFSLAIAHEPDESTNYFNRGLTYLKLERFDAAADDFRAALRIASPSRTTVVSAAGVVEDLRATTTYRIQLGRSLELAGKHQGARKVYEEALRVDPNSVASANALAWLLATSPSKKVRDPERAIELALQACEASRWQAFNHLDTLAAANAAAGRFEQARIHQRRALQLLAENSAERHDLERRLDFYRQGRAYYFLGALVGSE